jgi:hypothetical protein
MLFFKKVYESLAYRTPNLRAGLFSQKALLECLKKNTWKRSRAAVLSKPCGRRCRDHIRGKIFFSWNLKK